MKILHLVNIMFLMVIAFFGLMISAEANSPRSEAFVKTASTANLFEIKASQLALKRSNDDTVRDLAERIIRDHMKAGEELREAVDDSNVSSKFIASRLDKKHQAILDKLKNTRRANFDREYLKTQTNVHQEAITLFRNYARNGEDDDLQDFAEETLPTLIDHREHVQDAKAEMREFGSSNNY